MSSRIALGLVHCPPGMPLVDRHWARALVIRHARDRRLRLLDVVEVRNVRGVDHLTRRLAEVTSSNGVTTLLTDGLDIEIGETIASHLGLRHVAVPPRERVVGR